MLLLSAANLCKYLNFSCYYKYVPIVIIQLLILKIYQKHISLKVTSKNSIKWNYLNFVFINFKISKYTDLY